MGTMRHESPTHYEILRVPRRASHAEIKTAFRRLAKVYHPDATPGMEGSRFRQICDAYKVLRDPGKRRAYDREILARENAAGQYYHSYNLRAVPA
jgi:DnaJ-class molecular chaperone